MMSQTEKPYKHLEPRPGSRYRALWLKGRRIRAATVWELVHGPDPYTAEEYAENFHVPLEAVLEALDYVEQNQEVVEQDRKGEAASLRARGLLDGPVPG
jgi:uncharacterized protein (DUF433 family)